MEYSLSVSIRGIPRKDIVQLFNNRYHNPSKFLYMQIRSKQARLLPKLIRKHLERKWKKSKDQTEMVNLIAEAIDHELTLNLKQYSFYEELMKKQLVSQNSQTCSVCMEFFIQLQDYLKMAIKRQMQAFGKSPRKLLQDLTTGRFVKRSAQVAESTLPPLSSSQTRATHEKTPQRRKRTLKDKIRKANKRKKIKELKIKL